MCGKRRRGAADSVICALGGRSQVMAPRGECKDTRTLAETMCRAFKRRQRPRLPPASARRQDMSAQEQRGAARRRSAQCCSAKPAQQQKRLSTSTGRRAAPAASMMPGARSSANQALEGEQVEWWARQKKEAQKVRVRAWWVVCGNPSEGGFHGCSAASVQKCCMCRRGAMRVFMPGKALRGARARCPVTSPAASFAAASPALVRVSADKMINTGEI